MAEASLSNKEENYVRMSLLLTGISPRGVRALFDREFAPICLYASLKKKFNKLNELKRKHIISQSQWNLLFTKSPDVPDSKTFDITLMITLLRNLTNIVPPHCGYDRLPTTETTPSSDLSRIKYYRNYLAHLDDGKIDTDFFNTAWTDITGAIDRLGGQIMKQECVQLKTKPLDQTNQEIIMDIKRSNDEIKQLKGSLESLRSSHLKMERSQDEVKKSHALLQEQFAICQQDTVPWNIRVQIKKNLEKWKNRDKMFVKTRAAKHVLESLQIHDCVTITASSGVGKTATLQHVALEMGADGYDILIVTEPGDIVKFYNPNKKTLFVVDDLCGNFSLNHTDVQIWEPVIGRIKDFLEDKQAKFIVACRLQVYQDKKFDRLSIFKLCVCNLLSNRNCLLKAEKQSIAEIYLTTKAYQVTDYYDLYDCFPLICQLYHENPTIDIKDFFMNPFSIYKTQIDQLQTKGFFGKHCALALCVMFNNKINEEILTGEIDEETRTVIENTCEACRLDRGTSRLVLKDELDSLLHTFLKKQRTKYLENHSSYSSIHDKVFDFLAKYFGQKIVVCLIKNADRCLIRERFLLGRMDYVDQFITILPQQYHQLYMRRIIDDWSKGQLQDVFNNRNMKIHQFRQQFLCYLNTLDIAYQKQLVYTFGIEDFGTLRRKSYDADVVCNTVMLLCCFIGDISMIQWCCSHGVGVNDVGSYGQSPLTIACRFGHTETVKMLLNKGANFNKLNCYGQSSVLMACQHGYTEILMILINRGANYNKRDCYGQSPILMACKHGHTEIVRMLIEAESDYNKCDNHGWSPVLMACKQGFTEIVRMLLDKGASNHAHCNNDRSSLMIAVEHGRKEIAKMLLDKGAYCNKCDKYGWSPLMMACKQGFTEIVEKLLIKGANYHAHCDNGRSSLMIACEHGHKEIAMILLDKGADCNKCDKYGWSPVMMACIFDDTEIVKMLLGKGADYNKCDNNCLSPVMMACKHGHKEIVRMLLHKGADYNKCSIGGHSPVLTTCRLGHTEILKMMLDNGADYNKCNKGGQSPVIVACMHGNQDIVKMLIAKGADYNTSDNNGLSPLMIACRRSHKEIVKMLLDKGADYNKCDNDGVYPLMMACLRDHKEIVRMLLDKGADYNKCGNNGVSPLMLTCEYGRKEIVSMLIDKGADYNKCGSDSVSPLMMVRRRGKNKIVRMLLDKGADRN